MPRARLRGVVSQQMRDAQRNSMPGIQRLGFNAWDSYRRGDGDTDILMMRRMDTQILIFGCPVDPGLPRHSFGHV